MSYRLSDGIYPDWCWTSVDPLEENRCLSCVLPEPMCLMESDLWQVWRCPCTKLWRLVEVSINKERDHAFNVIGCRWIPLDPHCPY